MTVNGDYQTLSVCTDCYQAAANGVDDPYADFPAGFVEAFADSVRAWGGVPDPVTVDQDGNPIEGAFSWGGCPWCGSTQGGDRFKVELPAQDDDVPVLCAECGGECDAADAVADDSGLAWCGSVYGNGCADRRQQHER